MDSRRLRRPLPVLLAVAALGLAARLFRLGDRVAHQDEGRVGDWILHYMQTGEWQYNAIIHGPFLPHVNGVVFSHLGPSDVTARLVVAVVGALLPLVALLFRDRLREREVLFTGVFLAINPVFVYYSRFMRNDLLLAAFALAAVGFGLRAVDRDVRYVYPAALALALAFTTKENALLYPVAWLGALALCVDWRLFRSAVRSEDPLAELRDLAVGTVRPLAAVLHHLVAAFALFAVIFVAFYAPKPDLYVALGDPGQLPGVLSAATVGVWHEFQTWTSSGMHQHSFVAYLGRLGNILVGGAFTLTVLAVLGTLHERYRGDGRDVVAFTAAWGFASVFGYVAITDLMAGWTALHILVALAVPAGVGAARLLDWHDAARDADESVLAAAAIALLVGGLALSGGLAAETSYVTEQSPDNPLVQYAQPSGEMKPVLHDVETISERTDGVDVTFYGGEFYAPNDTKRAYGPDSPGWFARLPLPWYFDSYGANVSSTTTTSDLEDAPPVVITLAQNEEKVGDALPGYWHATYQGYLWDRPLVFYVDYSRYPDLEPPATDS